MKTIIKTKMSKEDLKEILIRFCVTEAYGACDIKTMGR